MKLRDIIYLVLFLLLVLEIGRLRTRVMQLQTSVQTQAEDATVTWKLHLKRQHGLDLTGV